MLLAVVARYANQLIYKIIIRLMILSIIKTGIVKRNFALPKMLLSVIWTLKNRRTSSKLRSQVDGRIGKVLFMRNWSPFTRTRSGRSFHDQRTGRLSVEDGYSKQRETLKEISNVTKLDTSRKDFLRFRDLTMMKFSLQWRASTRFFSLPKLEAQTTWHQSGVFIWNYSRISFSRIARRW